VGYEVLAVLGTIVLFGSFLYVAWVLASSLKK
jgi:hypothetical protein